MSSRVASSGQTTVLGVYVAACLGLLVVAQGGFFALPVCAIGMTVCLVTGVVWLRKTSKPQGLPIVSLLFVGLLAAYLIGALAAGATFTTLAETGTWATCAGLSLLVASMDRKSHAGMLHAVSWMGLASAVAGIALFAIVPPTGETFAPDRLSFTFEYANGAAAWFVVCFMLCLLGPSRRLRSAIFVPLLAVLLTQSGGATASLVVVVIALGVWAALQGRWGRFSATLLQAMVAFAVFAVFRVNTYVGLAAMALLLVFALRFEGWDEMAIVALKDRVPKLGDRLLAFLLAGIALAIVVIAMLLLRERLSLAVRSWVERMYQIRDGLTLWQTSPVLGVGPDNWQYLFPWVQTAPYNVSVVHSSIVQLLLDAGVLGLTCLVASCVLGMRGLLRDARGNEHEEWALPQLACVLFLLLHSLVEFDLQFCSLASLLAVLLSGPASPRARMGAKAEGVEDSKTLVARRVGLGVVSLAVCLPLCLFGVLCASGSVAMTNANRSGAFDESVRVFESVSLARGDVTAQEKYVEALFAQERYTQVTDVYGTLPKPSNATVLYAAIAYSFQGDANRAGETLISRMEQTPYDSELLGAACRFEERFGIGESQRDRFVAAVETSRLLIDASEVAAG